MRYQLHSFLHYKTTNKLFYNYQVEQRYSVCKNLLYKHYHVYYFLFYMYYFCKIFCVLWFQFYSILGDNDNDYFEKYMCNFIISLV